VRDWRSQWKRQDNRAEVIASLAEILQTGKAGAFLRSKTNGYAQADLLIDEYDFIFSSDFA